MNSEPSPPRNHANPRYRPSARGSAEGAGNGRAPCQVSALTAATRCPEPSSRVTPFGGLRPKGACSGTSGAGRSSISSRAAAVPAHLLACSCVDTACIAPAQPLFPANRSADGISAGPLFPRSRNRSGHRRLVGRRRPCDLVSPPRDAPFPADGCTPRPVAFARSARNVGRNTDTRGRGKRRILRRV